MPSVYLEMGWPLEAWEKGVTTAANKLIEMGIADSARLGVEGTSYGGVSKPKHSHLPALEALTKVGDAFAAAPEPIRIHFDVGGLTDYQTNPPNPYIIQANLARGGKSRSETLACVDAATGAIVECLTGGIQRPMPGQYPLFPGTVGWKTGFRFMRDELLGFDRNRKDMFRYVLFAHFLGMPKEPCLNVNGTANFVCQDAPDAPGKPNLFHVPVTNSGIADFPGGDFMVALGGFDDENKVPVGTRFMQAGTLLHEFGHTGWLTHSGPLPRIRTAIPRISAR